MPKLDHVCVKTPSTDHGDSTGLGSLLMGFHSTVAANLPPITKVMLTCFLSNHRGLDFYKRLGFEKDDISPEPRKLRYGKIFTPDYVILSKTVRSTLASRKPAPGSLHYKIGSC
jgi:hypothetical protein